MRVSMSGVGGRLGAAAIACALVFGVALFISNSSASAQQGPAAACDGDVSSFPPAVFGDTSNSLVYPARTSMTIDLSAPMPAGTYGVNTVTYDGDENRITDHGQHQEIISLSFLDATGRVLATTAMTEDLADGVLEATGWFDVGPVTIAEEATQVRADHGATEPTSKHSVHPVCVGVVPVGVIDTTTTAGQNSTTTAPTDQTTTPPVATSVKSQTTVQVTTPPSEPPGTTPPAPTVVANPRFTG